MSGFKFTTGMLAVAVMGVLSVGTAQAQQPTPDANQMIEALKPRTTRALTRTMAPDQGPPPKERVLIDNLRKKATRAITIEEREQVLEIAKEKPQISLEITFDYNSANINPKA